ncbi:MAG: hypothetical protein CMI55_04225 [Parcubacteria group bacterium]|nr:hypothetical protein [Parcubacteria group bacterium]|tara:strand:+ start:13224 stop:13832 length:609 start_codon:yes stop_codon:yes gene_type:complete
MLRNKYKNFYWLIILILVCLPMFEVKAASIDNPLDPTDDFATLVSALVTWVVNILTVVVVIMVIWAGFMFVKAGGNEEQLAQAKKNLAWTFVGLVVILIGQGWVAILGGLLGVKGSSTVPVDNLYTNLVDLSKYFFGIIFALAVMYFVWGGLSWMTAGGDEEKTKVARQKLLYGLIGILIIGGVYTVITVVATYFGVKVNLP